MSECSVHKIRKRPTTCEHCRAELGTSTDTTVTADTPVRVVTSAPTVRVALSEQSKAIQDAISGPCASQPGSSRIEEGKYIRVLIEAEIQKSVAKIRAELNDVRNLQWEHLFVPDPAFCMDLMFALEKDYWKYCDHIKNPRLYGYSTDGDFYLMQRIIRKDNPPVPDFTKSGAVKRYIEKKNGKENQA